MSHFYSVFPLQASIPGIYAQVMVYVAPAICSFVCAMLALVLMRGNRSAAGRYMKLFSALGLFLVGILWLWAGFLSGLTFSPEIAPEIAAGLQGVLSSGAPEALPAGLTPEITPEIATGLPADFSSALRTRVWAGPLAAVICAAEIVLLYSILRYEPTRRESLHEEKGAMVEGGGLTRKAVEEYFHTVRPFVNPEFRLEELAEAMDVNRTDMSTFINTTFGMNFKRYVNRWRLDEFKRLMSLPSNERKNPYKIMPIAGFTDPRHYKRALAAEQPEAPESKTRKPVERTGNRMPWETDRAATAKSVGRTGETAQPSGVGRPGEIGQAGEVRRTNEAALQNPARTTGVYGTAKPAWLSSEAAQQAQQIITGASGAAGAAKSAEATGAGTGTDIGAAAGSANATVERNPAAGATAAERSPAAKTGTAERNPDAKTGTAERNPAAETTAAERDPAAKTTAAERNPAAKPTEQSNAKG